MSFNYLTSLRGEKIEQLVETVISCVKNKAQDERWQNKAIEQLNETKYQDEVDKKASIPEKIGSAADIGRALDKLGEDTRKVATRGYTHKLHYTLFWYYIAKGHLDCGQLENASKALLRAHEIFALKKKQF